MKFKLSTHFRSLLGLVLVILLICHPALKLLAKPAYTPDIRLVYAKLGSFRPARTQPVWILGEGIREISYHEALVISVEFPLAQMDALPQAADPRLYIGPFGYRFGGFGINPGMQVLEFHVTHWEELPDDEPMILTAWPGGPTTEPELFANLEVPHFHHDMIEDERWKVFGGLIYPSIAGMAGSQATVTINGGGISHTLETYDNGSFAINYPNGIKLESGELYQVEVIVNNVLVFSETFTKETSDYPKWRLKVEPQESVFFVIKGHVYDMEGNPLPKVTVTVEGEYGGQYTTTSSEIGYGEDGYYGFTQLFAGNYTLTAAKEGYTFAPVKVTGSDGQPVLIDLVEKKPTQCLLYAVHDTAKSTAQLLTVDLSANELEITPLDWKLNQAEISLAVGNFDSDGAEEIVTAAQKGGHTITLWELDGQTTGSFGTLLSGILLAAGDLDGDGSSEIIAASRSSDRNTVNVYTASGKMLKTVKLFDNKTRIAPVVSDVDGDGKDDIIAGSLLKANQVAIYYSATQRRQVFSVFQEESRLRKKSTSQGKAKGCEKNSQGNQCDNETTAVSEPAPSQDSGLSQNPEVNQNQQSQEVNQSSGTTESVKTVDTTPSTENQNASKNQNSATVDTTPSTGSQDSSENQNSVIVESVEAIDATPSTKNQNSPKVEKSTQPTYGVQVATGDFDGDGTNEIVAAQASKGSRVEIYQLDGTFQHAFDAFDSQQGVVITVGNVVGDSSPEIIVGEAKGHLIRVFSGDGEQLFEWEAVKRGEVSSLAVFGCL
jgi:hypothetical protein